MLATLRTEAELSMLGKRSLNFEPYLSEEPYKVRASSAYALSNGDLTRSKIKKSTNS